MSPVGWRAGPWRAVAAAAAAGGALVLAGCGTSGTQATPATPQAVSTCGPGQVQAAATSQGAALGHAGVLFTLRNTSADPCQLDGFPHLQLLGAGGRTLPTTVVPVRASAYLFRGEAPRPVTLRPGVAAASFDLQYGNAPAGAAATQPPATACPAAISVRVILPGSAGQPVVRVRMAPCGGQVMVSAVVAGTRWLSPPR